MNNEEQAKILITNALQLAKDTSCDKVFLFLNNEQSCKALGANDEVNDEIIAIVIPQGLLPPEYISKNTTVIHTWSGNQTRFSRIKYAFMQAVLQQVIQPDSKVLCILGPWPKFSKV